MKESNTHALSGINYQSRIETGGAQRKRVIKEGVKYHCNQCNHKANLVGSLAKNMTVHDRVKYSCKQCDHRANKEEVLLNTKGQYIKKASNTNAGSAKLK